MTWNTASNALPPERAAPAAVSSSLVFDDLYAQFGSTVYARCRQILRDEAAAEDVTQEVFFRLHDHLDRIAGKRQALAWLYRTATNRCLDEIRNGRTRAHLIASAPGQEPPSAEQALSERDLVVRLLSQLPEELALCAWLYHVDGMEQSEIAALCGVSRRTVIARLGRFAKQARALLDGDEHG